MIGETKNEHINNKYENENNNIIKEGRGYGHQRTHHQDQERTPRDHSPCRLQSWDRIPSHVHS